MSGKNTSSGLLGGLLIGGAVGSAVLLPFAIFWKFGLHVFYEVAAVLSLLMWVFAGDIARDPSHLWIAAVPWWLLASACGALGLTTRILAMRGHLPAWAAGRRGAANK